MLRTTLLVIVSLLFGWSLAPAGEPIVVGERLELKSRVLGEPRAVLVRVPAAYARTTRAYPVLYLTDGEAQFVHTAATVEFLARAGRIPELIVVGIVNTNRTRDLTPTHVTEGFGGAAALAHSGGADRFLEFIESELMPWVEARYRTEPFRVFAGHSFGGLFALHAFWSKPALFHGVIAVSPTLHWDGNLPVRRAREALAAHEGALKRTLVVTVGDEPDLMPAYRELQSVLGRPTPPGFRAHLEQMREEDHGSIVLLTHYQGLRAIFEGWAPPAGPATLSDLRRHYESLSARFDWTVRPPEFVVNLAGYRAMADGRPQDALELFRFNIEAYPDSANVYDSYGEGLEAAGRLEEAVEQYRRAVETGERTGDPSLAIFKQHLEAARKAGTD